MFLSLESAGGEQLCGDMNGLEECGGLARAPGSWLRTRLRGLHPCILHPYHIVNTRDQGAMTPPQLRGITAPKYELSYTIEPDPSVKPANWQEYSSRGGAMRDGAGAWETVAELWGVTHIQPRHSHPAPTNQAVVNTADQRVLWEETFWWFDAQCKGIMFIECSSWLLAAAVSLSCCCCGRWPAPVTILSTT